MYYTINPWGLVEYIHAVTLVLFSYIAHRHRGFYFVINIDYIVIYNFDCAA